MATEEDFDRWIEITRQCKYLPENELKVLLIACYKPVVLAG